MTFSCQARILEVGALSSTDRVPGFGPGGWGFESSRARRLENAIPFKRDSHFQESRRVPKAWRNFSPSGEAGIFIACRMKKSVTDAKILLPKEVEVTMKTLTEAGFKAYIVGGCLRDILLDRTPKDWDVATDATPEQIQAIFPDSFYENTFGTVGIKIPTPVGVGTLEADVSIGSPTKRRSLSVGADSAKNIIEVTTFRIEEEYSDKRHPDKVSFAKKIEDDLARRDFTINAMAWDGKELVDPYDGKKDLHEKVIRTVGDANKRFKEDALRLMRAIRFSSDLNFKVEEKTQKAIKENAKLLEFIAKERIGDEFRKLVMTKYAVQGIELMHKTGMLKYVLPELEEGWEVTQNKHHIYTVWEHNIKALQYTLDQDYSFEVRLASLLHDVGKPRAKRGEGIDSTFYGHEVVGARMTIEALERLHFSKKETEKIALLVRAHMFNYDPDVVGDASVRRLVAKVGEENVRELVQVREADRIGSGVKKAVPYKLRHFMFRVEKVLTEPVSRKNMKIEGNELMEILDLKPGPKVGAILDLLFDEIIDDPSRNEKEYLIKRAREIKEMSEEKLSQMRKKAQEKYEEVLEYEEGKIKDKYGV